MPGDNENKLNNTDSLILPPTHSHKQNTLFIFPYISFVCSFHSVTPLLYITHWFLLSDWWHSFLNSFASYNFVSLKSDSTLHWGCFSKLKLMKFLFKTFDYVPLTPMHTLRNLNLLGWHSNFSVFWHSLAFLTKIGHIFLSTR